MNQPKRLLFGYKPEWVDNIVSNLDAARFTAQFERFESLSAADLLRFDAIVPLDLPHFPHLRLIETLSGAPLPALVPPEPQVDLADDKAAYNAFLIGAGFRQCAPTIMQAAVEFPYMYKKKRDNWGDNSHIIRSGEDEKVYIQEDHGDAYFKQVCISGNKEYTTHCIALAGKLVYEYTIEFEFFESLFVKGRNCGHREKRHVPCPQQRIFKNILSAMTFTGVGCFNYKMLAGVPKIFEFNPRFGGSLPEDINNFADAYIASTRQLKQSQSAPANLTGRAPVLDGVISYLARREWRRH